MIRPRSDALMRRHGPESNARRAAATAKSMSVLSPSATWQITLPVDGSVVSNVFPEALETHRPSISICWLLMLAGRMAALVVAMVMVVLAS
jgi:hypothetical protein